MIRWLLPALVSVTLSMGTAYAEEHGALDSGPLAFDSLPGHARSVVLTVMGRLRGGDPAALAETLGVQGSALIRPERDFKYGGFGLQEVVLRELSGTAGTPTGAGTTWRIAGELMWRDLVGRRAITAFDASYEINTEGLRLTYAVWRPVFSALPNWRVFAVPPSGAEGLNPLAEQGFVRFLGAASDVAVEGKPDGDEGLIFMLFLMDRMGPETRCEPRLSESETGTEGEDEISGARPYENGWFVAGVPLSRAALDSPTPLWLKLVCWNGEGGFFSSPEEHLAGAVQVNAN